MHAETPVLRGSQRNGFRRRFHLDNTMDHSANQTPSLALDLMDEEEDALTRVYKPELHDQQIENSRVSRPSVPRTKPKIPKPAAVNKAPINKEQSQVFRQRDSRQPNIPNIGLDLPQGDETKVFRPPPELIQAAQGDDKATEVQQVSKELIYKAREARAKRRRERMNSSAPEASAPASEPSQPIPAQAMDTAQPISGPVLRISSEPELVDFRKGAARGIVYGVWLLAALLGLGLISLVLVGY